MGQVSRVFTKFKKIADLKGNLGRLSKGVNPDVINCFLRRKANNYKFPAIDDLVRLEQKGYLDAHGLLTQSSVAEENNIIISGSQDSAVDLLASLIDI